ncbi:transmembrane emp24 domain-containing protein p24delta3-like [Ipomoea triloba]|uniref:transmembrane emp24 domain-containing protein p24delta3-like n=1 Tax=Ipomoea triloba TaxID=35885 RepID=UPI00125D7945|nr:transmembrane emp24 domain-containing protein p24delta3-like [Ipomoea triloba]GMD74110.1 transmembrane emp24 domain-containing protein p24delta3-like [Ipomoea batatas]
MMNLVVLLALVSAAAVLPTGEALWLDLPSSGTKCVSEELHNNVVVLADYYIIGDEEHKVVPTFSVKVTSPYGNNLHHQENVTHGQFAFTTTESGNYLACFWMDGNLPVSKGATVGLDWKTGIFAKDWESVARKEKLEGVNIELMKLEGLVQAIHENLNYLKEREAEMREVSERTNARVAWFSIMSIGICIVVSLVQIWRLKTFFQKKKLI